MKKQITQNQLGFAIALVTDKYPKDQWDTHEKLAKLVEREYRCICSKNDIDIYYSPTVKEEAEDLRIMYENCL